MLLKNHGIWCCNLRQASRAHIGHNKCYLTSSLWTFTCRGSDGKTFKKPRRPCEKERLKLVVEYGLRCKRELWSVQCGLSRIRYAARMLSFLDEKDPRRIFEGGALLRRMNRHGLLDKSQKKLDYVLALTFGNFLERRLRTLMFQAGMAKSIHPARVLIRAKAYQH